MAVDRNNDMRDELVRLGTFNRYNRKVPQGIWFVKLAAAGFYLCLGDKVKCAFCEAEMELETFKGRNPLAVHREQSPHCPLVLDENTDNRTVQKAGHTSSLLMISSLRAGDSHDRCESQHVGSGVPEDPTESSTGSLVRSLSRGSASLSEPSQLSSGSATMSTGQQSRHSSTSDRFTESGVNSGEGQSQERSMPSITGGQSFTANLYLPEGATVPQSARPVQENFVATSLPAHGNLTDGSLPSQLSASNQGEKKIRDSFHSLPKLLQDRDRKQTGSRPEDREQRPKRPDLAVTTSRISTFSLWPHKDSHPPEEMAEAGFYYTGHDDLARCFFCKGGLKTWSPELRPWVQHAQWFPKCPFVLQAQGSEYVQAVQALKDKVDVALNTNSDHWTTQNLNKTISIDDDFSRGKGTSQVTPDKTSAGASNAENVNTREDFTESRLNSQELSSRAGELERLEAEEATILFLPCGHLVACAQCAPALRTCAICRQRVSGTVRIETD
ncbi:hypothetical protein C0Q70_10822 [Pomacea canaliculata]|uniref:RING-type domain-containing protein n=1 Tax=Pomacea canaliculata TaxID=400727 RepID=A0A2T7P484_POMCA|nr:hypothetical protein C0Q70_10822 [Pomacea canaliculata]